MTSSQETNESNNDEHHNWSLKDIQMILVVEWNRSGKIMKTCGL